MKKVIAGVFVCMLAARTLGAADMEWQTAASIEAAAQEHVQTHGLKLGVRQHLRAGPLDERIRLAKCPQPLVAAFAPGVNAPPRMTVEVRCPASGGWKVYVPVTVSALDRAVVVTRALERGHLLTAADVTLAESDVSGLPAGYARELAEVQGLRLARPIAAGTVLTPPLLDIEPLVRRGERVTVVAQVNGLAVRSQATALSDGGANQRIRLKSASSGREIEGVVRADALVEIPVR